MIIEKIELKGITLDYKNEKLFDNLDLKFKIKKLNCLLGRSGSGKTTILKIIAGIQSGYKGKVYFNDKDITNLPPQKRNIGWIPQQQLLFPGLNVYDNVAYGLKSKGKSREEIDKKVIEVSKIIGLKNLLNRTTQNLSGGEKQRVAIARALALQPQILLLDEPFSSLDAPERDRLALELREIQIESDITMIHVTHSPKEVELISDYVYVLHNGKIIQSGSIHELLNHPNNVETAKILGIDNVIEPNSLEHFKTGGIIPHSAIKIGIGENKAKIISLTQDKIYLQNENKITFVADNKSDFEFKVGDIVTYQINDNDIIPFS